MSTSLAKETRGMKFPFWRQRRENDLSDEIDSHLKMLIEERIARGESVEDATASARREFGNVSLVKETTRSIWGLTSLERLVQDVRYGFRVLRKSPVFSFVNAFVLRPLAVADPESLVSVASVRPEGPSLGTFSYLNYKDIRDRNDVLQGLSARSFVPMTVAFGGETDRVIGNLVTANYFDVLGVKPLLGRAFLPEEDRAPAAAPV